MKPVEFEKLNLTSGQTCFFYQITRATLQNWNAKGFPRVGRNRYPLVKGFHWAIKNVFMDNSDELKQARLRKEQARAWREELLAKEKAGELLPRHEAINHLIAHVSMAKHGFMNFPYRMAPVVAAITDEREAFSVLKNEIWEILRRFSKSKDLYRRELDRLKGEKG